MNSIVRIGVGRLKPTWAMVIALIVAGCGGASPAAESPRDESPAPSSTHAAPAERIAVVEPDSSPVAGPAPKVTANPEPPEPVAEPPEPEPEPVVVATHKGRASWYGRRFQGHKTASGERFDRHDYTAAHRKLPFGTRLRVTNRANGKSVIVRVNDRGPFGGRGRLIDISEAAARDIGMLDTGVARVIVEVLGD